jgi:hypothetical protein
VTRFTEWARALFKPKPDGPTAEELERAVADAEKLFSLWEGSAGEVTRRLIRERETALLEELVATQLTHEQYTHGRGRIAGYREAVAVVEAALQRGAAARFELDQRQAQSSAQRLR